MAEVIDIPTQFMREYRLTQNSKRSYSNTGIKLVLKKMRLLAELAELQAIIDGKKI